MNRLNTRLQPFMRMPVRIALIVVAVAMLAQLLLSLPTEASGHSAMRSFSSPWVLPSGELTVTIQVHDLPVGLVSEELPAGFTFVGTDFNDSPVEIEGQMLTFNVIETYEFTYTVMAPDSEGAESYLFAGFVVDLQGDQVVVEGDTSVRVGAAPTPVPTPTPMPEPTVVPTPTPAPTPTQTPPPATTPAPDPTPDVEALVDQRMDALATAVAEAIVARTPTGLQVTPVLPLEESTGPPSWVPALFIFIAVAVLLAGLILFRRRQDFSD